MSKFYKEVQSGNIFSEFISLSASAKAPQLEPLTANTTDAAQEKHVPVVTVNGNCVEVTIGSVPHPMLEEHWITGIYIETARGGQHCILHPGDGKAAFTLADGDTFVGAYEYCNLHGLWNAK